MGVVSLMDLMSSPLAWSARMADSRPAPGPVTRTSTERTPFSLAPSAQLAAASCAAKGVPLREPLNPMRPAEPGQDAAFLVRDRDDRVVEGGLHGRDRVRDVLLFFLRRARTLSLRPFDGLFGHRGGGCRFSHFYLEFSVFSFQFSVLSFEFSVLN
jgi:hypothetical protein